MTTRKTKTLSKRDRELIQQLQDKNRQLNEQIQKLTLELDRIKTKPMLELIAQPSDNVEYSGNCNYMFIQ